MMQRRTFLASPALALAQSTTYQPAWESLRRHQPPAWYNNAKLGIFVHWGLYSVPAFATPTGELGKVDFNKWFFENPYAEWYLNTLRLEGTKTREYHAKTYGADFDYYGFRETFEREAEKWDPAAMAALFRKSHARYVVLTTKHHDGFTLWPSRVKHPKGRAGINAKRDIVGDLTKAVRAAGMRMGHYYSGGLDWTFETRPIAKMADLRATIPQGDDYCQYADAHWREIMDRYETAILWNDIGYPTNANAARLFADYYNRFPEGLVNNRFGVDHADITTPEYARYDKVVEKKWESCRGLGFSFGYNRVEDQRHVIAADKLVEMFVDIVSKNGNLLLNVGPRPDGSIDSLQLDRLRQLGQWLDTNHEAIFDSTPWVRPSAKNADSELRFTRKSGAVYAIVFKWPGRDTTVIPDVIAEPGSTITALGGAGEKLAWKQDGRNLNVAKPVGMASGPLPVTFKITPAPAQVVKA